MANVQRQFDVFNSKIKLLRFDDNQVLREKRDIIRSLLSNRLPAVFESHNEVCPTFEFADQGSYKMGTGIRPQEGDQFDIDQGIHFSIASADHPDPVVLKQRILEALDGHTKEVRIRNSCVTVFYEDHGVQAFHVDLAVYADGSHESDHNPRLAKGKEYSDPANRSWEISLPAELADFIYEAFSVQEQRQQFRRLVRYLKRWRDLKFTSGGNSAPIGLVLTILATGMRPQIRYDGVADDLRSLSFLVKDTLASFVWAFSDVDGAYDFRLDVKLPVQPYDNLLGKMTNRQMRVFKERLSALDMALDEAIATIDTRTACLALERQFGPDFPVPALDESGKKNAPAIASASTSA